MEEGCPRSRERGSGEALGQGQRRHSGGCQVLSYPDEQLCEDYVGHGTGQVQCCAPISVPVGLVHFLLGAMGQQCHHEAQVILHHRPQQLLPQGDVRLRQRSQEELLLVLGPDPALLLLPARSQNRVGWKSLLRPLSPTALTIKPYTMCRGHRSLGHTHWHRWASPAHMAVARAATLLWT